MPEPADVVLIGGNVITCDALRRIARGVAIRGDRIVAVGSSEEMRTHIRKHTTVIELQGRAVMPGLIDTHAHMDREGLKSLPRSLAGVTSIQDIMARIESFAKTARPGEWIVTMPPGDSPYFTGVDANDRGHSLPNRWELDSVAPQNPVFIRPPWGYWSKMLPLQSAANSRALALAGITAATVVPGDGIEIERDPRTGEPTGIFREHTPMPTLELSLLSAVPGFSLADRIAALRLGQRIYHGFGTTSIFEGHGVAPEVIRAYQALEAGGELTMRTSLVFSPPWRSAESASVRTILNHWLPWLADHGIGGPMLRISGIFTEAGEPAGHALRLSAAPYTGWAGFCYDATVPRAQVREIVLEAARAGIRVTTIFTTLLDLFEEANRIRPLAALRWVISHVDRLSADDIRRLKDLGVVVTFHTNRSIATFGPRLVRELGPERSSEIVPMRAMLQAGVPFALSTDNVPVSLFHPVWHSVARLHPRSGERIAPDQGLTREEALVAATVGGAYVTGDETRKGSLEPNKLADLVVLSADPLTVAEDALKDIVAETTIIGGRVVFERNGLA